MLYKHPLKLIYHWSEDVAERLLACSHMPCKQQSYHYVTMCWCSSWVHIKKQKLFCTILQKTKEIQYLHMHEDRVTFIHDAIHMTPASLLFLGNTLMSKTSQRQL